MTYHRTDRKKEMVFDGINEVSLCHGKVKGITEMRGDSISHDDHDDVSSVFLLILAQIMTILSKCLWFWLLQW